MNRNMKLVNKRQSLIGVFITLKRAKGYTIKKAVEEAAFVFSVGIKPPTMIIINLEKQ